VQPSESMLGSGMLFTEFNRTDSSPKGYMESSFAHLDRRFGANWDRVRDLVEEWLTHWPASLRDRIQERIRSGDDCLFNSTFLELYTHELLLSTGHVKIEVEPRLGGTNKRPDFRVQAADASTTIVECVVVTEMSEEERQTQARLNSLYDALNRIRSPDFYLHLDVEGGPGTPLQIKQWCDQIQDWVGGLDYDHVSMTGKQGLFDQLPRREWTHEGVTLTVRPIVKPESVRGQPGVRPIGTQSFEGHLVTSHVKIRDSIRKKATRYGDPKLPFVVVANCIGDDADHEEIQDSLYGANGLWRSTNPPLFTRLSGVIVVHPLFPWSVPRADICFFHNSHARHPYRSALTDLPQGRWSSGRLEMSDGIHPRELFGLSTVWPTDDADQAFLARGGI
jgi:hypothetical protein